jgi:hypothetical protein
VLALHHPPTAVVGMRTLREIEDDCNRVNRQLDLEANPGYTRRIGRCPKRSIAAHRPIDRFGHEPTSGRCGITAVVRRGRTRRFMWLPCQQLSCQWCRPRLVAQRLAHYQQLIGTTPIYARVVAQDDWARVAKRLWRAGAQHLRFDQPDHDYLVLTTDPTDGKPVEDLEGWLTSAFAQLPTWGKVTSSRAWALARADQPPSGWELVGISLLPAEDVARIAEQLGIYAGGGHLTDCDDQTWIAFCLLIDLHHPDHQRWKQAA